jgi:hypothetical protein
MKGDIDMTKALLDRILRLVIASVIVLGLGTSLLTEAMAQEVKQEAKPTAPSAPVAEEEKPTTEFTLSALSAYIWRGQQQTKDSMVIQPSATVGYKGFTANLWGNIDTNPYSTTDASYSSTWTETDLTLSYSRAFGPVTAGIGYIYYGLNAPNAGAADPLDSQELFISLAGNVLLTPTLTVYKEIDHYHQWYFLFGVSHSFELTKMIGLKLGGSVSYLLSDDASTYPKYNDNAQPTTDKYSNFHDGVISATLPITPMKYLTIAPTVSWVFPIGSDAKNEMQGRSKNGQQDNFFYGGINVSFAF